jgi:glycosyltransferase involved in cell wall biosynthesis
LKKVLIITYYWPPSGGAGVQRWLKFVKYLRNFQWEPIVFTVENGEFPEQDQSLLADIPQNLTVIKQPIKEPYALYKWFTGRKKNEKIHAGFLSEKKRNSIFQDVSVWIRGNVFIPDARMFWIKPSVKSILKWLKRNKVDAIVSTGPPHSCHLIALKLKMKTGLPWLADFRDPWTNIDFYKDLKLTSWADKKHHILEKKVVTEADAVVTIGKTMQQEFQLQFNRRIECITNGYDDEDIRDFNLIPDQQFSLVHVGTLVKTRNPTGLWQSLKELIEEIPEFKNHLQIKLVGKADATVIESLNSFGLDNYVQYTNYLEHSKVVCLQQQAQLLLLLINRTPNAKGVLTGKMFEYLAAKRPILCIGPPDGDAAHIIEETKSGKTVHYDDIAAIKKTVLDYYRSYLNHHLNNNELQIDAYSRKNLTAQLVQVLNRISNKNP